MMSFALMVSGLISLGATEPVQEPIRPVIDGPWWSVANRPQLSDAYHSKDQEPVDFAVWQAADGTWQLWSCIRNTRCGGHTRLFYGWEGRSLTDSDWTPQGVKMESRPDLGEAPGGLQAPHVIKTDGRYLMAYGDWDNICFAESQDGKHFERIIQPGGKTALFGEGPGSNTRDPMLLCINGTWHCYYTAIRNGRGYGFCRTSADLKSWSPSCVISYGGSVGPGPWFNECPHVVEVLPGEFVYFRNQFYGQGQTHWAYYSQNPLNFGIDDDTGLVARLPLAAPEIIRHEGRYYMAALKPGLDGIQIARLRFARCGGPGAPVFNFNEAAGRDGWKITEGQLPTLFCDKPHADFQSPSRFVIGTGETNTGVCDDNLTCVVESPVFELTEKTYYLYVGGGNETKTLYVAIIEEGSNKELARYTGSYTNAVQCQRFMTLDAMGRKVRIRIVDQAKGPWGHINFAGIFTEAAAGEFLGEDPKNGQQ